MQSNTIAKHIKLQKLCIEYVLIIHFKFHILTVYLSILI